MLDLAISINTDAKGTTIIETDHGIKLKAPRWPQDSDYRLVAFSPSGKTCDIIWPKNLAGDIGQALRALQAPGTLKGRKPDWYRRLAHYAKGAHET